MRAAALGYSGIVDFANAPPYSDGVAREGSGMPAPFLIIVALALSCVAFTAVFSLAYLHLGRRPHAKSWALSFAVAALMFTVSLARDFFPSVMLQWLLGSALSCTSVMLGARGHLQRLGKQYTTFYRLITLATFAVVTWATVIEPHAGLRMAPNALHAGIMYAMVVWLIVSRPGSISPAEWGMAVSSAAFAACQSAAGLVALSQGATLNPDIVSIYAAINFVAMPACFLGMGMFAVFILAADLAQEMRELASIDSLTGLANRRGINEVGARAWASAQRAGQPVSILLADLDGFKQINDDYGHAAGDAVLTAVAELLQRDRRANDLVGRWGGEEFLLMLTGPSREEALAIAADIDARIQSQAVETPSGPLRVSASVGVATALPKDTSVSELTRLADVHMYERKIARKTETMPAASARSPDREPSDGSSQ